MNKGVQLIKSVFIGWGRGCGGGVMEREWVAAFDLLPFNSFEQLSETTEQLYYVDLEQWKIKAL